MKVIGIVAEYNPFHNGHKYQIDYARNVLKADYIIVAMSGPFTQRGDIACFDKYSRAEMALKNGADIVFEIPAIFATSSAKEYASCSARLLAATGLVDTLLFGAETQDKDLFLESASLLMDIEKTKAFNSYISQEQKNGTSYALARANYMKDHIPAELMTSSNNILGLEYTTAILEAGLDMSIEVIKRQGNNYNDRLLSGSFSSATAIRRAISQKLPLAGLPDSVLELIEDKPFIEQNDMSLLMHYKLLAQEDFSAILDCSKDLSDRINKYKKDFISIEQFCHLIKTKNYTYTRINRLLTHILLDMTKEDFDKAKEQGYVSYLRMLGFSERGSQLLAKIKQGTLPLLTSPSDLINPYDLRAADIYKIIMTEKIGAALPNEYSRKFTLVNI